MKYSIGARKIRDIVFSPSYPEGRNGNSYSQRGRENLPKWTILISVFFLFLTLGLSSS